MSFDKQKYDAEFARQAYDRISIFVPKGKRAVIREYAQRRGMSVNKLAILALETLYKLDLS